MSDGVAAMAFAIPYVDGSGARLSVSFDQLKDYGRGHVKIEAAGGDVLVAFEDVEWFANALLSIRTTLINERYLPLPAPPDNQ